MNIVLIAFVALAHTVETITGFGATIIALSLGSLIYPVDTLVISLAMIGWLQSVWIVSRGYRHVDRQKLLRRILPYCAVGFVIGIPSFHLLAGHDLRMALALFVISVSLLELRRLNKSLSQNVSRTLKVPLRKEEIFPVAEPSGSAKSMEHGLGFGIGSKHDTDPTPLPTPLGPLALIGGGFFHGLIASGGPMVVLYASRELPDKRVFRSTLSVLWLLLNTVLIASYLVSGRLDRSHLVLAASLLPGVVVGIIFGELLHHRVAERTFRNVVQVVLLMTGLFLLAGDRLK